MDVFYERIEELTIKVSPQVLSLLCNSLQQHPSEVLETLALWIQSNDITVQQVLESQFLPLVFQGLQSPHVDQATEVIVMLLRQNIPEYEVHGQFAQLIMPYLLGLESNLATEDIDEQRVYARIYTEAAETFTDLILSEVASWVPFLKLFTITASYDLDIIPMTFPIWGNIAERFDQTTTTLLVEVYSSLVSNLLKKMTWPETFTAEELDEFRRFRHEIGDVLKDSVTVCGPDTVLRLVLTTVSHDTASIEGMLFALRAISSKVPDTQNTYISDVFGSILPNLAFGTNTATNDRLRYAAILLCGSYATWFREHPEFLPWVVDFVARGFSDNEKIKSSAALALNNICHDVGDVSRY